jgi:DNA-binding CsgD family transcriptional regulator
MERQRLNQALLTREGETLYSNIPALGLINGRLGDVVGKPFWETAWFIQTQGIPEIVKNGVIQASMGVLWRQIMTLELPTGVRTFDVSIRPVRDNMGKIVSLVPEGLEIKPALLNKREKEILYWVAKGKTAWEVATILTLSRRTVEWYINQARTKLNATTMTQAVAEAIKRGKILP